MRISPLLAALTLSVGCAPEPETPVPSATSGAVPTVATAAASGPASTTAPATEPQVLTAQQVRDFERTLAKLAEDERRTRLRAFATRLGSVEAKVGLLEMIDDRFVSHVPLDLVPELIAPLLADPEVPVRVRAAQAVAYVELKDNSGIAAQFERELLAILEATSDEALLAKLVSAYGSSGYGRLFEPVARYLAHTSPDVRAATADTLCRLGPCLDAVGPLVVDDAEPAVRRAAVYALARLDPAPPQAADRIAKGLDDRDARVRAAAVASLHPRNDGRRFATQIGARLNDPDPGVRTAAAQTVAGLQLTQHAGGLRKLLKDEDEQVRTKAAAALALLEKKP